MKILIERENDAAVGVGNGLVLGAACWLSAVAGYLLVRYWHNVVYWVGRVL